MRCFALLTLSLSLATVLGTFAGVHMAPPQIACCGHTRKNYLMHVVLVACLATAHRQRHCVERVSRDAVSYLGLCPSTVRPVFPVLVFQLGKQQNHTRTTSSTLLGQPPNRTQTKLKSLKRALRQLLFWLGSQLGNPPKIGTFTAWSRTRNRTWTHPDHWAAAHGGVTNGGLRGVWPPFLEIGLFRPFLPFSPFLPVGCEEHLGNPHWRHSNRRLPVNLYS